MNDPVLCNRINRLKDDVVRFRSAVCAYEVTDASRYPDNFEQLGLDMAMKAEALACSVRNIVSDYPKENRPRVLNAVSNAQGVIIREEYGTYEIIMPYLMPKRNSRNNVEFILEPLSYSLEEFCKTNRIERLEHAVIWFIYEYAEGTHARHIRDYDNLEAKEVLDLINAFFLVDDGGDFCELHYSTRRGKRDLTRVIISADIGLFSCPKSG